MKNYLATAMVFLVSFTPLAAQSVVGDWIGKAPDSPGKGTMKIDLHVANEGGTWTVTGVLYKDGKEIAKLTGKDIKAAGVKALQFTEEFDKTPPEWAAKPTKVTLIGGAQLTYDREFGKKRAIALLQRKTPGGFDKVILGKVETPNIKNDNTGAPVASDDPNLLKFSIGPLLSVLFTADGKTMVTAGGDSVIRMWDLESRKQKSSIVTDKGLGCLAMTPDASLFAGGLGNTPIIWDAAGKEVARFPNHIYGVSSVALSPDGKILISSDNGTTTAGQPDGNTKIWDVASGKEIANIPECGKSTLVSIPSADRFVFVHGRYVKNPANPLNAFVQYYKVYNTKGKLLYEKATNHQIVRHVGVSPDEKRVVSACLAGNINILNVATGKIERTLKCQPFSYINTATFTPDGKQFAVGGSGGQVVFFDAASGKQLRVLKAYPSEIGRIAITPDGRFLIAAGSGPDMALTALKE